ncbi:MAG TPA: tetratricopeptide repeat protein [Gemmataceae bacterium]|jgi:hypothetical protein|nr:tetratricopeptide repeat protein [Gemmataceae bacterium]
MSLSTARRGSGKRERSALSARVLVAVALACLTLTVFWHVRQCDFVNYDDPDYVSHNPHIQSAFSFAGLWWALTSTDNANWHPLTWLSLQLDYQFFGLKPGGYHISNLLLHAANGVLLFWVLQRMTRRLWPSAVAAALFALHPLHVESQAWISERKDVLSALFWMLTLLAYVRYTERPGLLRYGWVVVAFTLGLMAKPMLVTLPCVLLVLDYWPLQRSPGGSRLNGRLDKLRDHQKPGGNENTAMRPALRSWWFLVLEKAPLFLLIVGCCVLTVYAQRRGLAMRSLAAVPFWDRLANAVLAYGIYIVKMFWPQNLAVFYPYTESTAMSGRVMASGAALAAISLIAIWQARRRPYLLVGWLWYLGTLAPVIGLVQVGDQAFADRYTYIPLIGLFIMAAWSGADLAAHSSFFVRPVACAAIAVLVVCGVLAWIQLSYWHDSIALWKHSLEVTGPAIDAHYGLATAYRDAGRTEEAIQEFRKLLDLKPEDEPSHYQLSILLGSQGKFAEAIAHYKKVLHFQADNARSNLHMAIFLIRMGNVSEARGYLAEAYRQDPDMKKEAAFQAAERVIAGKLPSR